MSVIEVDQSGRIEVLTVDTALGFSNDRQAAILIPASVKRGCSNALRARGVRPKMISIRMFAGGLFLLLESHLHRIERVTIDRESPGWEAEIRGLLLKHIRQQVPDFASENITFAEIGRASRARSGLEYLPRGTCSGEESNVWGAVEVLLISSMSKEKGRVGACIRALAAWLLPRTGYRRLHQATQLIRNYTDFLACCQIELGWPGPETGFSVL